MADYFLVPKCRLTILRKMYTNKVNIYFEGISSMQETFQCDIYEDMLDTISILLVSLLSHFEHLFF